LQGRNPEVAYRRRIGESVPGKSRHHRNGRSWDNAGWLNLQRIEPSNEPESRCKKEAAPARYFPPVAVTNAIEIGNHAAGGIRNKQQVSCVIVRVDAGRKRFFHFADAQPLLPDKSASQINPTEINQGAAQFIGNYFYHFYLGLFLR